MKLYVLKDDFRTMDDYGADVSDYTSESVYGVFDNLEMAEKAMAELDKVAIEDEVKCPNKRSRFTIITMERNELTEDYYFMIDWR